MTNFLFQICWCILVANIIVASRLDAVWELPENELILQLTRFIKTSFPNKHINVFHGMNSQADTGDQNRENLLRALLSLDQNRDSLQTFTLVSAQANVSLILPQTWSKVASIGYFHQQYTECAALNLFLLDGQYSAPLFSLFAKLEDFMTSPATDRTLLFQLRNYKAKLMYVSELRNMKYKLEVIPSSTGLIFRSFCFYCNKGEPSMVDVEHDSLKTTKLFPDYTRNLHGKTLRFSTSLGMPTMVDFRQTRNGSWEYFGGFLTPFLDSIKRKLNCNVTVHPIRGYGRRLANGTFTGVLGLLVTGRVDFGMTGMLYDGHFSVDYLHVVQPGIVVVSSKVPAGALRLHAIFQAFGYRSWSLLIAVCLGVLLPFYIFMQKLSISMECYKPETRTKTFTKAIRFIFHPLLEQGLARKTIPTQHSGRIFLAFWLYVVLVIITAYKSNLRDLMILSEPEYIPTKFDELAELPEYELYAQSFGGVLFHTFKAIPTPVYKNLAQRLRPTDSMLECLGNAIYRPKAVCINYNVVIQREANLHFTDRMGRPRIRISSAENGAFYTTAVIVTRKKDVLGNTLNSFSSVYYSMGLTQRGYHDDVQESASKGKKMAKERDAESLYENVYSDGGPAPLKLQHFQLVFLILIAGLIFGFLTLLLERIQFYRKGRNTIVRIPRRKRYPTMNFS